MTPSIEQLDRWRNQLAALAGEMESAFGPPGETNQDPLDAAVHVAYYVACKRVDSTRTARVMA